MALSRMLMALAIATTLLIESAMSATYTVGDAGGWELGTDLKSWASSKKFLVGDILNFQYSEDHDVLEVSESDFSCISSNPITRFTGGNTTITLSTAGKRFFICGTSGHCTAGMKVEIQTLAGSSSPPPAPSAGAPPPPPSNSTPSASPPGFNASPPAPTAKPPSPASPSPAPESPAPPFSFELPLNPTGAPSGSVKPLPPPSSGYKCSFRGDLAIGFSFVIVMLLGL